MCEKVSMGALRLKRYRASGQYFQVKILVSGDISGSKRNSKKFS